MELMPVRLQQGSGVSALPVGGALTLTPFSPFTPHLSLSPCLLAAGLSPFALPLLIQRADMGGCGEGSVERTV